MNPPPVVRFRSPATEEPTDNAERAKSSNPLANIRLRPRGFTDSGDSEASTKNEDKSPVLIPFRLRAASGAGDEANRDASTDNPLSGVRLRMTGINVTDPLKSPNNSNGDMNNDNKNDATRNSLTSKLKPPPLAPKPRPWSFIGSDKKGGM